MGDETKMGAGHGHPSRRGFEDVSRSRTYEGVYGRLFRNLPPANFGTEDEAREAFKKLAATMIAGADHAGAGQDSSISSGYTYFGQFIDHDLTFDPATSLERDNDPDALVNHRTPRFDLDSLYGRGPLDQPYLYQPDRLRFLMGRPIGGDQRELHLPRAWDVPRLKRRAVIGDPRNSENVILSQLHALFLRFHNRLADRFENASFGTVQKLVRWHYQWVIIHDFLKTLIEEETYYSVLPHLQKKTSIFEDKPALRFYKPKNEAFMPVEFSAAAYRFGHSMVRPAYRLNPGTIQELSGPLAILSDSDKPGLQAFQGFRDNWSIDWDLFFPPAKSEKPTQFARRIDTTLEQPLHRLPFPENQDVPSLAERNLLRGWRLGLPNGESVADAMDVPASRRAKLALPTAFTNNTPLWFYILAEAQQLHNGNQLGPVGSRIVMETFAGLSLEDGYSYLRQAPSWRPDPFPESGVFGLRELIDEALLYKPKPGVAIAHCNEP